MPTVGAHDCFFVAANNLVGHAQFSRPDTGGLPGPRADCDFPVAQMQPLLSQGLSPYAGQVQHSLAGSYKVFLRDTGSFLVMTKLHVRDGPIQWHVMGLDADRDIFYFGLNDGGYQTTFLVEKPDRIHEGLAKENLLKHFPELKRIEVVHVVKMQLKVSQLKHAPKFVAYEVRRKRGLDEDAE